MVFQDQIYSEVGNKVCAGVYIPQQRVITREIFSNEQVDICEDIYT